MSWTRGWGGWFGRHDDHHHGHHGGVSGLTLKGTKGDDVLTGGNLDDLLLGGKGNDTLDGGAGSDKVFGGHGNDVALYSMAGSLGAGFADIGTHDVYDGGKGFDTLVLQLTYGERALDGVQADIDAFEAYLAAKANACHDHGKAFHFQSFDLDARNFEALQVELVNSAPTARGDSDKTNEDTPLSIAPAKLLANDSDTDHLDAIHVIGADALSARGAAITLGADGSLGYDPSHAPALQQLAEGETLVDNFSYTIADLGGANATASVRITVTGVNDAPEAHTDTLVVPVVSGGGSEPDVRTITFEGATSPDNVDGFSFAGFTIFDMFGVDFSYMAAAGTGNNNAGGGADADGAVGLVGGGDFAVLSLSIASFFVEPTVTIVGYRDGVAVDGAQTDPLTLNAGFQPVSFGAAWSSIDELRFYSDFPGDYILIDNLQVAVAGSGGGGVPHAEAKDIDVLANDTDVDHAAVLQLLSFDDISKMGAAISKNADGTLHYDPTGLDLPLAAGETATDTFHYTIADEHGATSVASVVVDLLGADDLSLLASLSTPDANLL